HSCHKQSSRLNGFELSVHATFSTLTGSIGGAGVKGLAGGAISTGRGAGVSTGAGSVIGLAEVRSLLRRAAFFGGAAVRCVETSNCGVASGALGVFVIGV